MFKNWGRRLASIQIFNFVIPLIILFVVMGTIAQKFLGLHEATQNYFLSPLADIAGFKVPGMPVFFFVLAVNLICNVIYKSPWRKEKAGIIIAHIGVVLLLFSALFSSFFVQEGYIELAEGQGTNYVSDYHKREFTITDTNGEKSYTLDFSVLLNKPEYMQQNLPFRIDILEICQNCEIKRRENTSDQHNGLQFYGMAQHMQLQPKALALQNEENMSGVTFRVSGTDSDGIYTVIENVNVFPALTVGEKSYQVKLRKQIRTLPFSVKLIDFERVLYPGTNMAKSYSSKIELNDNGIAWNSKISMNEPYRYKGYALFQSSFINANNQERSILAVVYNPVRSFSYIAGFIVCFGLLLHLIYGTQKAKKPLIVGFFMIAMLSPFNKAFAQGYSSPPMLNTEKFAHIPVLHEGRIKPMDSFARAQIKYFSGAENYAIRHILQIIFAPDIAITKPLIQVQNKHVRAALDLNHNRNNLYSYTDLETAFLEQQELIKALRQKEKTSLALWQKELLRTYEKLIEFQDLSASLSLFFPISAITVSDLPDAIQREMADVTELTFYNTLPEHRLIDQETKALIAKKGTDIASYSDKEQALATLIIRAE